MTLHLETTIEIRGTLLALLQTWSILTALVPIKVLIHVIVLLLIALLEYLRFTVLVMINNLTFEVRRGWVASCIRILNLVIVVSNVIENKLISSYQILLWGSKVLVLLLQSVRFWNIQIVYIFILRKLMELCLTLWLIIILMLDLYSFLIRSLKYRVVIFSIILWRL